jgi:hypothetical protein
MLSLKNNLTENPVENYMIKNNSITVDKLSQYKDHTWSWDFNTHSRGSEWIPVSVKVLATKSSPNLNDVTMYFTDHQLPITNKQNAQGSTEPYIHYKTHVYDSTNDSHILIKKLGTSYINIDGLPDPNDYLTCPDSFFEIKIRFKVSYTHNATFGDTTTDPNPYPTAVGYYLRNLINSAINLSYEWQDAVIIKVIHIDNDSGEKVVMTNSNYPITTADLEATWANVIHDTNNMTPEGSYIQTLKPVVLKMRLDRKENNKYSLTNTVTRFESDSPASTVEAEKEFTLEYTNPNNNPLLHESIMRLFTFDEDFGGSDPDTTQTYLGGLSFRYYTPPFDLGTITTGNIIGETLINNSNTGNPIGIKIKDRGVSNNEVPIVFGFAPERVLEEDGTMALCSGSSTDSRRFKIENQLSGGAFLRIKNSEGEYAWGCMNGSFYIFDYTAKLTRYLLDSSGHHNFQAGNLTTTGNISTPNITTTGQLTLTTETGGTSKDLIFGTVRTDATDVLAGKQMIESEDDELLFCTYQGILQDIRVKEILTGTGCQIFNTFSQGIRVRSSSLNQVPIVMGFMPNTDYTQPGTMVLVADSATGERGMTIHNGGTGSSRLRLTNSEGGFDINTDGGNLNITTTSGSTGLSIDSSTNFNFQANDLTTTGSLTSGSITTTGSLTSGNIITTTGSLILKTAGGPYAYIESEGGIHFRTNATPSDIFLIRDTQLDVYKDLVLHEEVELKFANDFSISNTLSGSQHYLNLKLDGVGATKENSQITWFHRGSGIGSQRMENGGVTTPSTNYCGFYPENMRDTNIFRTTSNTYVPYFQKGTYAVDENNNIPTTSYGLTQIFVPWDDNSGGLPVREFRVGTTLYVAKGNNARNAWTTWRYYDTTSTFTASHSCSSRTIDFKSNQTPFLNGRLVEIDPDADYNDGDGWTATIDEALPQVKFTETRASKKVLGVISYKLSGTHNPIQSLGEGCMWVCNEDGNIEVGDLLISSSHEGYATKQSDDLIRNYTVGKSTCNCNFIIDEGNCSISGNIEINTEQGFSIIVNSNNTITIGEVTLNYTGTIKRLDEDSDIVLIENGTIHATGNYPFHHNIGKGVQINSYIKITDGIRYSFIGCIYTAG